MEPRATNLAPDGSVKLFMYSCVRAAADLWLLLFERFPVQLYPSQTGRAEMHSVNDGCVESHNDALPFTGFSICK